MQCFITENLLSTILRNYNSHKANEKNGDYSLTCFQLLRYRYLEFFVHLHLKYNLIHCSVDHIYYDIYLVPLQFLVSHQNIAPIRVWVQKPLREIGWILFLEKVTSNWQSSEHNVVQSIRRQNKKGLYPKKVDLWLGIWPRFLITRIRSLACINLVHSVEYYELLTEKSYITVEGWFVSGVRHTDSTFVDEVLKSLLTDMVKTAVTHTQAPSISIYYSGKHRNWVKKK